MGFADSKEKAWADFNRATELMSELGLEEAREKRCQPDTSITWLGIHFNSEKGIMSVPKVKISECLKDMPQNWPYMPSCKNVFFLYLQP